jgi:hypothetical protein
LLSGTAVSRIAKPGAAPIPIAVIIVAFVVLWLASLQAARLTRGALQIAPKAIFLILTCVGLALVGFLSPALPILRAHIDQAVFAGAFASIGAILGMYVADIVFARIGAEQSRYPT